MPSNVLDLSWIRVLDIQVPKMFRDESSVRLRPFLSSMSIVLAAVLFLIGGAWSARSFFVHAHDGTPHVHHITTADRLAFAHGTESLGSQSYQASESTQKQGHAKGFYGGSVPEGHDKDAPDPSVCRLFDLHCNQSRLFEFMPDDFGNLNSPLAVVSCAALLASTPVTGLNHLSTPVPWNTGGSTARSILLTSQAFLV